VTGAVIQAIEDAFRCVEEKGCFGSTADANIGSYRNRLCRLGRRAPGNSSSPYGLKPFVARARLSGRSNMGGGSSAQGTSP